MKKTYKITFKAELSEDDLNAMQSCFYQAMNEAMEIEEVWGLEMEVVDGGETDSKEVSFDEVLPVVMDWFSFIDDADNIAQTFAIGMSEGKEPMDILIDVCSDYRLDVDEFEGICPELEDLRNE